MSRGAEEEGQGKGGGGDRGRCTEGGGRGGREGMGSSATKFRHYTIQFFFSKLLVNLFTASAPSFKILICVQFQAKRYIHGYFIKSFPATFSLEYSFLICY